MAEDINFSSDIFCLLLGLQKFEFWKIQGLD